MAHRVMVREIDNDEESRLLQLVRRGSGPVVTWRRAQMVLLTARGMDVAAIADVAFTSPDRVRDVLHNFNDDGFESLHPHYAGGRPPKFSSGQRDEIKKIALDRSTDHGLPFSTWSLSKLADYLVDKGVVEDISHEGLRMLLPFQVLMSRFQSIKTWKGSTDPDYEAKAKRVQELYDIADGKAVPGEGDPGVEICMDEFGPLNLQPHPGYQWPPSSTGPGDQEAPRRQRATYTRPHGVRHLMAAYDLSTDKLYGHVKAHKRRTEFLAFMRYVRSLHQITERLAIVMDNYGPHLSTKVDPRIGDWAVANNVELAYVPYYSSWLNRIEPQFTALRYFALDGTDHPSHREQSSMIRRSIIWRNHHTTDPKLRKFIRRASLIKRAKVA